MPPPSPAPKSTLPGSVTLAEFETLFGDLVGEDGYAANLAALAGHVTTSWESKLAESRKELDAERARADELEEELREHLTRLDRERKTVTAAAQQDVEVRAHPSSVWPCHGARVHYLACDTRASEQGQP
jgi:hypothetical protein